MKKQKIEIAKVGTCKLLVFWNTYEGFCHVATFYGWNTFYVFCESLFPQDINCMAFVDEQYDKTQSI